jgi:Lysine methyltransferase
LSHAKKILSVAQFCFTMAGGCIGDDPLSTSEDTAAFEGDSASGEEGDIFADVGFMFEANQPVRTERFLWNVRSKTSGADARDIAVTLNVADDSPGAVQSGHYLWPAAALLCDYLVAEYESSDTAAVPLNAPVSIVELGAGCALVSLTVLQLWQDSLQCVCITDHDPGTLIRARDNLETTIQSLLGDCEDDDHLNAAINSIVSIPVLFEPLKWGDTVAVNALLQRKIKDHVVSSQDFEPCTTASGANVVLGSDLIYCVEVVQPLFETAAQLLGPGRGRGRFLLSQSFRYDPATEVEIDRVCSSVGLSRAIVLDGDNGSKRVQEFAFKL